MTFETFKSILLIVLVSVSLLLTLGLWNYQPDYQHNTGLKYVNEVDLGGDVESTKTMIQPSSIIFHINNQYFGFNHAMDQLDLYEDMQEWELLDIEIRDRKSTRLNSSHVAISYAVFRL